nr:MAG TPA: hypothetical protein [Caudoviricetes sp.]
MRILQEKHRFIEYIYNIISNMIREKGVCRKLG